MPRIPTYAADVAPGVPVRPEEMIAPQKAAARMGLAMIDTGEAMSRRAAEIQEDIDNKVALDTFGKYSTDVANRRVEMSKIKGQQAIQTNEDGSFKLITDTEKWHNDKAESYGKGLYNDAQREKFGKLVAGERHSDLNWTATHIAQSDREYTQEVRHGWKQRVINEIAMSNGDQTYIDNRIAAYQEIAKTLKLDDATVQRDITEIQTHAMKTQKDARTTAVLVDLKTRYAGDPEGALKEASSPEFLNQHGVETQRHVRSVIAEDMQVKKYETDKLQGNLLAEFSQLKREGKSRTFWYRKVEDLTRQGKVTDEFQRSAVVMQNQDIQEAKTGGETNPVAYATLHEKVMRGAAKIEDIMGAKGISFAHKNTLIDKFYSKQGSDVKEAETQAKNFLKSQLVSTGPLGNPLPAEHERLFKAYEAIDVHADAARKAGKPWTVKEYMDYATQLANFYRPTIESKVRDMNSAFRAPQPAQAATPEKTQPDMKRKPGESIDAYLKRTGQE